MNRQASRLAPGGSATMLVVAAEYTAVYLIAALPSPLYPLYQRAFHFSGIVLTLIYAVYVVGNLFALLLFGRLADQIGRRRTILPVIGIAILGALLFAFADSIAWLFAARFVSGFATALAAVVTTAWIVELHPRRDKSAAAAVAGSSNLFGFALGSLLAGMLAQFAAWPLRLSYIVYLCLMIPTALAVWRARETVQGAAMDWQQVSLRPRVGVPKQIRWQFVPPAAIVFAVFALGGFYAALIPGLLGKVLHAQGPAVSGAVLFELFGVAALTILITHKLSSRASMLGGAALLPPGVGLLVATQLLHSMPLLLLATAVGGVAVALGYRGSLEVVNEISPGRQRSEVVSSYNVCAYVGIALPVIGVGVMTEFTGSLVAHIVFAIVISLLALIAFVTGLKFAPR